MGQRSLFKWQKVCGILSEAMSNVETGQISNVIIGMGINFQLQKPNFLRTFGKSDFFFPDGEPTATRMN